MARTIQQYKQLYNELDTQLQNSRGKGVKHTDLEELEEVKKVNKSLQQELATKDDGLY